MLEKFLEVIENYDAKNTRLFFITREVKPNIPKRAKVMDKFKFNTYAVNSDKEVKEHLHLVLKKQIDKLIKKKYTLVDFDVISDDTTKIFSYDIKNKKMSFNSVMNNDFQSKLDIPNFEGTEALTKNETLWAYCIGVFDEKNNWYYSFKKILSSKVAVDSLKNPESSKLVKAFRTKYNDSSRTLEVLHGETINLDSYIDCLFFNDIFYVVHKSNFEKIINLEAEYKETAIDMVNEMKKSKKILGADILLDILEHNPKYHKKIVKIKQLGVYEKLDNPEIF